MDFSAYLDSIIFKKRVRLYILLVSILVQTDASDEHWGVIPIEEIEAKCTISAHTSGKFKDADSTIIQSSNRF